ncbi:MAG: flagellin, partial [Chloroflexota bacterium]|nr:flagellin [Chloroflexota bacterium]
KEFRLLDQYGGAVAINDVNSTGTTSDWQAASSVSSSTFDTERGLTITFGATAAAGEAKASYTAQGGQVDNSTNATQYLSNMDDAVNTLSSSIASVGSLVARLTYKEDNLSVAKVNSEAAYSRIMSADMAYEQLQATKMMILQQTATAMLAQANVAPQSILALFK